LKTFSCRLHFASSFSHFQGNIDDGDGSSAMENGIRYE
jgi:hypothetical protein